MSEPISAGGGATGNPWDRRSEQSFVSALIETVKLFITSPGEGYRRTLEKGDFAGPLIFAVIVGWIGAAVNQVWSWMFGASLLSYLPQDLHGSDLGGMLAMSGVGTIIGLLMTPIFIAIFVFIWSAVLHLCMMVVGGLSDSQAGFEGTFRVLCFAAVAQLASVVPFVGGLINMVWTIVLAVIGLAILHRTSHGKAIIAVVIPIVVCCVCGMILAISLGVGLASMLEGFNG